MSSFLVNTNVFLRFITKDIPQQATAAKERFQLAKLGKIKLETTPFVVAELLFVLQGILAFPKEEAVDKTLALVREPWISIERKRAVLEALHLYRENPIDFIDLLSFTLAKAKGKKILSFDKDFDKLAPKLREEP